MTQYNNSNFAGHKTRVQIVGQWRSHWQQTQPRH